MRYYYRSLVSLLWNKLSYKYEIIDSKYNEVIATCTDSIRAQDIVDALNK